METSISTNTESSRCSGQKEEGAVEIFDRHHIWRTDTALYPAGVISTIFRSWGVLESREFRWNFGDGGHVRNT